MLEKIINIIFDKNIDYVLNRVPKEYIKETMYGYKKYLYKKYNEQIDESQITESDIDTIADVLYGQEQIDNKYMNDDDFFYHVIEDIKMERFDFLYNIGKQYFDMKKEGLDTSQLTIEISNNILFELEDLVDKVKPFNKARAKEMAKYSYYMFDFALGKTNVIK